MNISSGSLRPCLAVLALFLPLVACGGGAPAAAPGPTREVGAFVVRLGADTVAVEQFARLPNRVEGRQVVRTPNTSVRDYAITLDERGGVVGFELQIRPAIGAEPSTVSRMEFRGDTAVVQLTRGDSTQTLRVPAGRNPLPLVGYSLALYEIPFAQLRRNQVERLDGYQVPVLGGPESYAYTIEVTHPDSVLVRNIAGPSLARVDAEGRLLAWDGTASTLQLVAERGVAVDLERLAAEFAARDAAGRGLGALSPRDTVRATVAGATIVVDYSRPSARGRQIFGQVVPWNQVWRTGANQATHFTTDRNLQIGGTTLPAGSYTLWTLPSPQGWQLIINRQTGQWGTDYDASQDVGRVPLQVESLAQRVEQFTIDVQPREDGGVLRLAWGDTAASVPFAVR